MKTTLLGLLLSPFVAMAAAPERQPPNLQRAWQGIPGLERTTKGRVFVSWFSGGPKEPSPENTGYLCSSDDAGKTFTEPTPMAGPRDGGRTFDPTLRKDPRGQLWSLLPADWNPKQAADKVLAGLVNTTAPQVKGAHDAEFVIVGDRAFVVSEANDVQPGENPAWPSCYATLSVVQVKTGAVEKFVPMAKSEQVFANATLPAGACFVPRIMRRDGRTLRCFFASEAPTLRQAQVWFIDFDLDRLAFDNRIQRAKLKTASGTFEMQPQHFHADAVAHGFTREAKDYGLYAFDLGKVFDGQTYAALNNYPGGQNALAVLNADQDTFEVLGHYNEPPELKLTESAVNRLPDGTWLAICRQEGGNANYTFTTSKDGRTWTRSEHRDFVPNGASSKPTFDKFHGTYYLGWQESTKINGVGRSVFNLDISRDGKTWARKYRFETEKSFQYPAFHEHDGTIWLTVTQGDTDASRKERIMFGRLE